MDVLEDFLKEKNLVLVEHASKGYASNVFLVKNVRAEKFALKIEKANSPRIKMAEKEVSNLKLANKFGIGPWLFDFDFKKRIILMEFVEGRPFGKWIFESHEKAELQKCIDSLLAQAKKLDEIGLSHGQLAGKGTNILVKSGGEPVIIDFEKASQKRKYNNYNQLKAFLMDNPNGAVARRIRETLNNSKNTE